MLTDGAAIDRVVMVSEQAPAPADVLAVGGGPLGEEVDDFEVEGIMRSLRRFPTGTRNQ